MVAGYVVMRISLTLQWLRAAACDTARRKNALRYAGSLAVIQVGWVASLFAPDDWRYYTFLLLIAAEMAGPYWAEHTGDMTQWHPKHIAERYGLFTIIVFGECILSSFVAIDSARTAHGTSAHLAVLGLGRLGSGTAAQTTAGRRVVRVVAVHPVAAGAHITAADLGTVRVPAERRERTRLGAREHGPGPCGSH